MVTFALQIDLSIQIHQCFQAGSQCNDLKFIFLPQLLNLVIRINLVPRTISLLKILPIDPWFHLLADGGVGFLVSFGGFFSNSQLKSRAL